MKDYWVNHCRYEKKNTYVDRDEFEQAVLGEDRDYDFMTSLRVVIEEGQTSSVCLHEALGGIVEGGVRMFV